MSDINNLTEKFKKLSSREHCLLKPGMYIGSLEFLAECELYRPYEDAERPIRRVYDTYQSIGLNTMFNECINNSFDERQRNIQSHAQEVVNRVSVTVNPKTGKLAVWDNGGIPVVIWLIEVWFKFCC